MSRRRAGGDDLIVEDTSEHALGNHLQKVRAAFKGEHQIAEYVTRLEIGECARNLAAAPESLPLLAARRGECRVGPGEERSFEEVIRTRTEFVLSGVEGG